MIQNSQHTHHYFFSRLLQGAKGKTRSKKPAALPVRKEDGSWALSQELDDDSDEEALGEPTPAALEKGKAEAEQAALAQEAEEKAAAPKRKAASQAAAQEPPQSQQQKLETIASLATTLLQSPEGSVNSIRTLLRYAADTDLVVARAGSISSMLVFKDLAPGYRIRPPTEKELEVTVSKEVQQLRKYENNFLAGASLAIRFGRTQIVLRGICSPLQQAVLVNA